MIHIYTDSCFNNVFESGTSCAILLSDKHDISDINPKYVWANYENTTVNRVKMTAMLLGLNKLIKPNSSVTIYTNLKYIVDLANKIKDPKNYENSDIWEIYLELIRQHNVNVVWLSKKDTLPQNKVHLKYMLQAEKIAINELHKFNHRKI